ncbi:MAG: hypothetical protein L0196_05390 [candidate division Zixibacteria bacterium]|nr:hypothetical protein [candidate division Zixibacteria bacterium]
MKAVLLTFGFILLFFGSARADNLPGAAAPFWGIVLSLVAGIFSAFGLAFAFKVYRLTRGGELSAGWQWLAAALLLFAASQLLSFLGAAGFAAVSPTTVSLLQFGAGAGMAFGVARIKKVMS